MRLSLAPVVILFPCASALAQGTWYVDAHSPGPGDGSAANPYVAIQAAISNPATHSGDTVLVLPGNYAEDVTIQNTGVFLRSTAGPGQTTIQGGVYADGIGGGPGPAVVEGFTISSRDGASLFGATLRRCIVASPSGLPAGAHGIFYDDSCHIDQCVVTGFQLGLEMFFFATNPIDVRNSILSDNAMTIHGSSYASFLNCCLPTLPSGLGITVSNPVLGDPGCWDAPHQDFHLAPGSLCIDAGIGTDPDGTAADIGAFPFDPGYTSGPAVYCSTSPTSDGCVASISATGQCSLTSTTPFLVTATQVSPNKLGRLLYSFGEANTPFQGGVLCLALPLRRTLASNSGSNGQPPPFDACSGVLDFDFNTRVQSGADPALLPGRIVYVQYRFRDPFSPGGYGIAFSDALRFGIAP